MGRSVDSWRKFYIGTGASSITALISAFLAIPILVLGLLAIGNEEKRKMSLTYGAFVLGIVEFPGGLNVI
ncbi:MAG: hypothetical protein FJ358_01720 [Thaumarchaeota archaeon]|nr:hypothetical protein [Nitrososphaerota archaeon]